jgi:hypothetical protein
MAREGFSMSRYANETAVSVEKTKAELERLLAKYSARQFVSGWDENQAVIGFVMCGRAIRFRLPLPDKGSEEFSRTPSGRRVRSKAVAEKAWEQACRSRWRALLLVVKAKLEAVECCISTFETEFMAWTVLPGDGRTVAEAMGPQVRHAIEAGETPRLLLPGGKESA